MNKDGYKIRYAIFNIDGTIKTYSDKTDNIPGNDFDMAPDDNNYKLIISPKNKAKCLVVGW